MAALGAPKSKNGPQDGPQKRHFWTQNGETSTYSQSSPKRKLYNNTPDIVLYLTPNKVHVRCFGVLTSIKSGLRFYVNLETDHKASWSPQEAEKVPTETSLDELGPQVEIKRGPRATQNRSKTQKKQSATIDGIVFPNAKYTITPLISCFS